MKFIWKIENFSHLKGGKLQSPSFSLQSKLWELIIHLNLPRSEDMIVVELSALTTFYDITPLKCSFALLDCEGFIFAWEDGKITTGTFGPIVTLNTMGDKFRTRKMEFLPHNTLIVQCCFWETADELSRPLSVFARSRIEFAKVVKTFEFNISEADLFRQGYTLEHVEPITNDEFLTISLISLGDNLQFKSKVSMFKCQMEIKILLLDSMNMKKFQILNYKNNFTAKQEEWNFFTKISRNMIATHQNKFLSDNTLSLQFICSFSENVTLNRIVDGNEIFNIPRPIAAWNQISKASMCADEPEASQPTEPHPSNTISQALQEVFKEGLLSDFNLKVDDRVFPVHKVILSARSQVFRVMFTTEMKEKEDNSVDIPDVDEGTLQRMLRFIYSDEFDEDMGWESASSLYAAADKYAIESLKQGCSSIIQSGLSVLNVLEVLSMADMHQDQGMMLAALDFISVNDQEIIGTKQWIDFEEKNSKLAVETFRKLYLKKMKG